jgi:chaperonin cofactor prefoldin
METRIKELEKSQNKLKETAEELQKEILEMVPVQTEVERRVFNQCLDYKLDR